MWKSPQGKIDFEGSFKRISVLKIAASDTVFWRNLATSILGLPTIALSTQADKRTNSLPSSLLNMVSFDIHSSGSLCVDRNFDKFDN